MLYIDNNYITMLSGYYQTDVKEFLLGTPEGPATHQVTKQIMLYQECASEDRVLAPLEAAEHTQVHDQCWRRQAEQKLGQGVTNREHGVRRVVGGIPELGSVILTLVRVEVSANSLVYFVAHKMSFCDDITKVIKTNVKEVLKRPNSDTLLCEYIQSGHSVAYLGEGQCMISPVIVRATDESRKIQTYIYILQLTIWLTIAFQGDCATPSILPLYHLFFVCFALLVCPMIMHFSCYYNNNLLLVLEDSHTYSHIGLLKNGCANKSFYVKPKYLYNETQIC